MKLREKTLILIGITVAFSIALMYIASNVSLIEGFENLEKQNTIQDVDLVLNSISNEVTDLNEVVFDWAIWDDTYRFIQDNNSAYIQSNLVDSTFSNLKLNFVIFIDNNGNIVYAKGFDLENDQEVSLPKGIESYLTKDSVLLNHSGNKTTSGIIQLPDGPAFVSSSSILPTNGEGPSKGTIIFGRMLNENQVNKISNMTKLPVTIFKVNDQGMSLDFQNALKWINKGNPVYVNPLNDSFIAGYAIVDDIYGNPAFIVRIDDNRSFYNEYENSLSFFILSILFVGFVLVISTLIYLDKNILSRLSRLDKDITSIGKKGNISARVTMDGADELSSLANSINTMLSKLEISGNKFKESELKFRSIVQLANDGIILADSNGKIILCNNGSELMFGYDEDELIGKSISELLPEEFKQISQEIDYDNKLNFDNFENNFESQGFKKDGTKFDLEISHTSWNINDDKYYCAIVRDITDRKYAENEIKKSLKEKEVMLKEIHHRVKNNMQIISSLLSLQCRYLKDKESYNVFKESQNRVKSMALVHENLYQTEGLAEIDFTKYTQSLVSELFRSYGVNISQINLEIEAEDILLDTDTAIPCGLIINELVTNSIKYAFNGGNGKIYIKLHNYDDRILLIVGDNGKGLPDDFDLENTKSLGLRLVNSLVHQINGTLELVNGEGVEFKIIFKSTGEID